MRLPSTLKTSAVSMATFLLMATPVAAVTINSQEFHPLGSASIQVIIGSVVRGILGVVGLIALVMFVYGGLMWMTSAGNTDRVEKAKQTLVWATIGILVTLGAATLTNFVLKTIGV